MEAEITGMYACAYSPYQYIQYRVQNVQELTEYDLCSSKVLGENIINFSHISEILILFLFLGIFMRGIISQKRVFASEKKHRAFKKNVYIFPRIFRKMLFV
jgi:hypothetical protein